MKAIYPGSFDPITYGHIDIIERATQMFDQILVTALHNPNKKTLFNTEERVEMLKDATSHLPKVVVASYTGLTAEYARIKKANIIIRGLRAVSDFDNELRIALANRELNHELDTVFLMTKSEFLFLSSSGVKEIASFGGKIDNLVTPFVAKYLYNKFKDIEITERE